MAVRKVRVVTVQSASLTLIAITFVMFLLQAIPGVTESLALNSALALSEPWRIITSIFLHGGFSHILFNMYALMLFGPLVEGRIGKQEFLKLFFVGGIIAAIAFILFEPTGVAVGASGAIMAILGVVIVLFPNMQVLFFFVIPMSMRTAGIIFAIIDLMGVFGVGGAGVANIAHLGGLVAGLAFGYYYKRTGKDQLHKRFSKIFVNVDGSGGSSTKTKGPKGAQTRTYGKPGDDKTIDLSDAEIDNYFKYVSCSAAPEQAL